MSLKSQIINPYASAQSSSDELGSHGMYRTSPWEQFLRSLGLRTGQDSWNENMQIQANEFQSALEQKQYDEQYNLPVNEVARMRAAGINPDLNGGDAISPGDAQPLGEDPSTPMHSGTDVGIISDFANGVLGAVSSAVGIVGSIQGITSTRLTNSLKAIENESAFSEFARGLFPYFLPESPEPEVSEDGSARSWQDLALGRAQIFAGKLPKSLQDKFISQVQGFWNSAPGSSEAYKEWRDRVSSRRDYFNDSSYFYDEQDSVMRIIADGLQDANERIYKLHQQAQESGESAVIEQNNLARSNAAMVGILRSSLEGMIRKLDDASKQSGIKGGLASVAMALLSAFQLYVSSQGLPSISRSSSFSNSYGKDSSHTESSGWSLNL